jgi:hypothetical protein
MFFRAPVANTSSAASNACSALDFNKPPRRNLVNPLRTLAAALAVIAPLAAQAMPSPSPINLIKNGSFESLTINNRTWTVVPGKNFGDALNTESATKYILDWDTDLTSGVEVRRNVAGVAQDGLNFIELDSHFGHFNSATFDNNTYGDSTNSWISQTVNTSLGQVYHLSYWYSARAGSQSGDNQINVFWDGVKLGGSTFTFSGSASGRNEYKFDVVGTGNTGTLKFADAGTANTYGASLDNVSLVAAVPEPETYALMMAGLGAVAFMARRRRPR